MSFTLLDKVSRADFITEPFPHVIIRNALDEDVYSRLERSFPEAELLSNHAHLLNDRDHTRRLLYNYFPSFPTLSPIWSEFAENHLTPAFFNAVTSFFLHDYIELFYPGLISRLSKFPVFKRNKECLQGDAKCMTDFQIVGNLPVSDAHSSRSPHLDNPRQLYAILFYMRDSSDSSVCGLNLYRSDPSALSFVHGKQREIDPHFLAHSNVLPYERNTAILFLNNSSSFHSVQPIYFQSLMRRSVNIIGELPYGSLLFKPGQ